MSTPNRRKISVNAASAITSTAITTPRSPIFPKPSTRPRGWRNKTAFRRTDSPPGQELFEAAATSVRAVDPRRFRCVGEPRQRLPRERRPRPCYRRLQRGVAIRPTFAVAYVCRGSAWLIKNDLPWAIADYEKAIKLDPQYAKAYIGRGMARLDSGDTRAAFEDFDFAVRLEPENRQCRLSAWLRPPPCRRFRRRPRRLRTEPSGSTPLSPIPTSAAAPSTSVTRISTGPSPISPPPLPSISPRPGLPKPRHRLLRPRQNRRSPRDFDRALYLLHTSGPKSRRT